jgi:hypothetical protein
MGRCGKELLVYFKPHVGNKKVRKKKKLRAGRKVIRHLWDA